jgi:ADP-heptose:LPS heptosyltransferase
MPAEEKEFYLCNDLIKYLIIHKKHVTLFLPEHKLNLLQDRRKYYYITYNFEQVNKFEIPEENLLKEITSKEFDVVVDLNRGESLFHSSIANAVAAKYRIGFSKELSDKFYNFQVVNHQYNAEISYRNLLNCFQMF